MSELFALLRKEGHGVSVCFHLFGFFHPDEFVGAFIASQRHADALLQRRLQLLGVERMGRGKA